MVKGPIVNNSLCCQIAALWQDKIDRFYLDSHVMAPAILPVSPVRTALRAKDNLLDALSPEMRLHRDDDWVSSFPADSEAFSGPGAATGKSGIVLKGKYGAHAIVIDTGSTRSGGGTVELNNENGVPGNRLLTEEATDFVNGAPLQNNRQHRTAVKMADDNVAAAADPNTNQPGYYPATDHAIPYQSEWSRIHDDAATKATLRHLGCNYLGTQGCPPTLIALKRHAQSLAILISRLSPSVKTGRVDGNPIFDGRQAAQNANGNNVHTADGRLELNDAFDWLADLSQPYNNDDPNHHRPLNILSNEVEGRHEVLGTDFHCPLTRVAPRELQEQRGNPYKADVSQTPYDSHHLLAMHANACLEHLDHEYSTTGGILSLIPEDGQGANTDELRAAQNSLLGQLLLYVQGLALRNHEMDMTNAKLADALAGEAVVPMQHLSTLGPDGRSGREIAYPQDRWVLVNSGDDVWTHLHDALDREEAALDAREHAWAQDDDQGGGDNTTNGSVWRSERGDDQHARGIVDVDISTRFYRLQGQGRSTIFVLPAFSTRPATEWSTRMALHGRPSVVGTVAPRWPLRASDYQRRWDDRYAAAANAQRDHNALRAKSQRDDATIANERLESDRQRSLAQMLADQLAQYTNRQPGDGDANNADVIQALTAQIHGLNEQLRQQQQRPPGPNLSRSAVTTIASFDR